MAFDWSSLTSNKNLMRAGGNALADFGYGLATAPTFGDAFGAAAQRGAQLQPYRDQQFATEQGLAKEAEQTNMTKEWLRSRGRDDLIPLVDAGQGMFALQQATAKPEGMDPFTLSPGQVRYGPNGEIIAQGGPETTAAPSGYTWAAPGQLTYIPGGPNDPAMAANKPPGEAERKAGALTTVTRQDAERLFGDGTAANPGIFEALGNTGDQMLQVGGFGINPLAGLASSDYKVAKDSISNIAQSYLYAMSGATAPPDEVRKITEQVTPMPLDSPAQKLAKRERLMAMYAAIEGAQGNAARPPQNGGWVDAGNGIRIRELP